MSRLVATIDLSAANVGSQGSFETQTPNNCSALYVMNESAAFLQLDLGINGQPIVQPWRNRLFPLKQSIQNAQWTVIAMLTSTSAPSAAVYVEAFAPNEIPTASLDGPVFRQSNVGNSVPVSSINTLTNDGNAAGTVIVEATPSGAASSQAKLTNDGAFLCGGGLFSISNAGIVTSIPAGAIPAAAISGTVASASSLNQQITSIDNGTAQLRSTVNARGIALGYNDSGGTYHQVLGVDGSTGLVTAPAATIPAEAIAAGVLSVASVSTTGTITAGTHLYAGSDLTMTGSNANIQIGAQSAANTPYMDMHSSGSSTPDVRLIASGGTAGTFGKGTLTIDAATLTTGAALQANGGLTTTTLTASAALQANGGLTTTTLTASGNISGPVGGGIPTTRNGSALSVPIFTGANTPSSPPTGALWAAG